MGISTVHDAGGSYTVTLADGTVMSVPKDPLNADYVRVQVWVAAGGVLS
ncbi:MAG TPA: hypothetical protein VHW09_26795 [Bryobacteraceae bacterium]|jgi:hypothetical protein|nr:hypothetical protein [Bryobacteraceae bacterium]